ncbi:MAG: MFS transporter [Eubacteriales bacterium]|nr:MFS transporter [Eubacteriales bacterium]
MHSKSAPRIALFYTVVTLYWMALYAYQPLLSTHCAALGASPAGVGAILSAYGLVQLLVRVPLGMLSDRIRKRRLFAVIGCALGAVSAAGLALARTPALLLVFRALAGASAAVWVVFTVLFSAYYTPQEASRTMARVMVFNNLGQMGAMLLGGVIAQLLGSTAAFWLAACLGLAAALLAPGLTERVPEQPPQRLSALLKVGLNGHLLLVSTVGILFQVVNQGAALGFVPTYAKALGASASQLGLLTALSVGGMLCGSLLASAVLLKRFRTEQCLPAGLALTGLCTVLIPVLGRALPALFLLQFFAGVGGGLTFPLLTGLAIRDIAPEKRGTAMGFFQSIYALGMFVGPLLTGFLSERFPVGVSLAAVGCVSFLALIPALAAAKEKRRG